MEVLNDRYVIICNLIYKVVKLGFDTFHYVFKDWQNWKNSKTSSNSIGILYVSAFLMILCSVYWILGDRYLFIDLSHVVKY